jgi:hypothetical protein
VLLQLLLRLQLPVVGMALPLLPLPLLTPVLLHVSFKFFSTVLIFIPTGQQSQEPAF